MPCIPRLCLDYVRKNANGHPVVVLTDKNLNHYAQLPEHILRLYRKGRFTTTHLSDFVRLALLAKHGGLWVDATLLVTRPLPDDIFNVPFFTVKNPPFGHFPGECRWTGFCLAAWKNHPLIVNAYRLLVGYWRHEETQIDYFLIDFIFDLLYHTDPASHQAVDAVPYSNQGIHCLEPLLPRKYDTAQLTELMHSNYLFKLSWKTHSEADLTRDSESLYNHLLNNG